jgi:uncharacterized protein (PEP-CTERM system associated)
VQQKVGLLNALLVNACLLGVVVSPAAAQTPIQIPPGGQLPEGAQPLFEAPREIVPTRSSNIDLGVTVQGLVSDNLTLSPDGQETSGYSLELSPYMEGYIRTARSRGDMALRLRGLYYHAGDFDQSKVSPDIRASGDLSILGDGLRVAGSAYVFRNNPSPFEATSVDPASTVGVGELYKAYAISPYSIGRLGNAAYELRYRLQMIDPAGIQPRSTGQQVAVGMTSDRDSPSGLGWSANADIERIRFEDSDDLTRSSAEALALFRAAPGLRLGAGVNYSRIDVYRNSDGDNNGVGPTALFSWRPGLRTLVTGKYSDTYYGSKSTLRITQRMSRWLFGLTYSKDLESGTESSLLYLDPNAIFILPESSVDDGTVLVRSLSERGIFSGAGQQLLFGDTGSTLVFNRNVIASAAYIRQRNSLVLSVFENKQSPAASPLDIFNAGDLVQRGVSVNADHRLTPSSSVFLATQYRASKSDQTGQDARLASLGVGWRVSLARQTFLTLSARTSKQSSKGTSPSDEYREQAAIAAIDYRF